MLRHCHECGYSTTDLSNFKRHVKAKHPYGVESKDQRNILSGNFVNNQTYANSNSVPS